MTRMGTKTRIRAGRNLGRVESKRCWSVDTRNKLGMTGFDTCTTNKLVQKLK